MMIFLTYAINQANMFQSGYLTTTMGGMCDAACLTVTVMWCILRSLTSLRDLCDNSTFCDTVKTVDTEGVSKMLWQRKHTAPFMMHVTKTASIVCYVFICLSSLSVFYLTGKGKLSVLISKYTSFVQVIPSFSGNHPFNLVISFAGFAPCCYFLIYFLNCGYVS